MKNESLQQESINEDMKNSFQYLLSSIESLTSRAERLNEEDRILSDRISGLKDVSEINNNSVLYLVKAVGDWDLSLLEPNLFSSQKRRGNGRAGL